MKTKNPAAVALGRLGGKAGTGKAKARTPEQARAAANARWELYHAEQSLAYNTRDPKRIERFNAAQEEVRKTR